MSRMDKFLKRGKSIFLAYDHGLEHGPTDFKGREVDPSFIIEIANKGGFDAFIVQSGIAENYIDELKIPLIVKLNGRTSLFKGEYFSSQHTSVKRAVELGAQAVGYTIYPGSEYEAKMIKEFGRIEEEAHMLDIPVIMWSYPRGKSIQNDITRDVVAYAARMALELGADATKVKYTGDMESFAWVVKSAGKIPVYMSGGPKTSTEEEFLEQAYNVIKAGAAGLAVGRNVWQSEDPFKISKVINHVVIGRKTVREAMELW